MHINPLGNLWRRIVERKPAIPEPAAVTDPEGLIGSDNPTREESDYSLKNQADAMTHYMTYDGQGQVHDGDEEHPHPKIDDYA